MMQKDAGRSFWSRQGLCIMIEGRYLQYTQDMQMHINYLYEKSQEDINEDTKGGTFGIRLFLCALMFAAFLTIDKQKQEVFHMSSSDIANEITKDTDIQEIWKSL